MWYVQGGTVAVRTVGLRTRNSEFLSVVQSMADGLQETCGAFWISIPTQTGFSRYSVPTPRHSDSSSRWPTTTLLSSTHSLRTHQSTVTSTGENSTGGQCCNGNNCRRSRDPPLATRSVSHSSRPTAYNPHTNESDYDDNKTPDIVDLYGEEVYNNID